MRPLSGWNDGGLAAVQISATAAGTTLCVLTKRGPFRVVMVDRTQRWALRRKEVIR